MPSNLVKTPEDEVLWERAKAIAHKILGSEKAEGFWGLVTSEFKKLKHAKKS